MPVKVESTPMLLGLSPGGGRAIVVRFDGSCPATWCSNGVAEQSWLLGQAARAGRLTPTSSLSGAIVSSVM